MKELSLLFQYIRNLSISMEDGTDHFNWIKFVEVAANMQLKETYKYLNKNAIQFRWRLVRT